MKILVNGGAGYIGSHAVFELIKAGHEVIVFDNLSTGNKAAIHSEAKFYQGDILDFDALDNVMAKEKPDAIIHFAAKLIVPESVENPAMYYLNNVGGVANVLQAMNKNKIKNIVFSSTAAVYGSAKVDFVSEEQPTNPESPYGSSKLMAEQAIIESAKAFGLNYTILRYFNVAGADSSGKIGLASSGDRQLTHLIPVVIEAAQGIRKEMTVFGNDYETIDGTCVRDYIHVTDLVLAHIKSLEWMISTNESGIFNLGSNAGFSIMEVINQVEKTSNTKVPYTMGPRRPGDAEKVVASAKKAKEVLGWTTTKTLEEIIESDWNWRKNNPNGFEEK